MDPVFIMVFCAAGISFMLSVYVFYHTCQEYYSSRRELLRKPVEPVPARIDVIVKNPDDQITVGSYVYKNNHST